MDNKITLNQIAHFLPYKLKCETDLGTMQMTSISLESAPHIIWFSWNGRLESKSINKDILLKEGLRGKGFKLKEIKPIVRTLEDLMLEEQDPIFDSFCYQSKTLLIREDMPIHDRVQGLRYKEFELLIKHNFDVFDWIGSGLGVDINSVKYN